MADLSMVLALGEACDRTLTELIDGLRQVMKTGYLSMFQHRVADQALHGKRNDELDALLESLRKDFHQLVDAAQGAEAYGDLYHNVSFVINDLLIMSQRLDSVNLRTGAGPAVIALQNVQNNLHMHLADLTHADDLNPKKT